MITAFKKYLIVATFFIFWAISPLWAAPEGAALHYINQIRIEHNLEPFKESKELDQIAKGLAKSIYTQVHGGPRTDRKKYIVDELNRLEVIFQTNHISLLAVGGPEVLARNSMKNPNLRKSILSVSNDSLAVAWIPLTDTLPQALGNSVWTFLFATGPKKAKPGWIIRLRDKVNAFRASMNLKPLVLNERLSAIAQERSDDMAERDYFSHYTPEDETVKKNILEHGFKAPLVLENLHGGSDTANGAVEGWKASKDGHREAMLNDKVVQIGVGYTYLNPDRGEANYHNYWTLLLATPEAR